MFRWLQLVTPSFWHMNVIYLKNKQTVQIVSMLPSTISRTSQKTSAIFHRVQKVTGHYSGGGGGGGAQSVCVPFVIL